jgi:enoyl-CoA hydratase/carnithine racemase
MQVMESLSKIMSIRNVIDWCIRGYNLDVKTAQSWGLISEIASTDNIDLVISKWLDEVTSNSPKAIQYGLEAFDKINSSESNHKYLSQMLEQVLNSDDAKEGIAAFKEKRNPNWK